MAKEALKNCSTQLNSAVDVDTVRSQCENAYFAVLESITSAQQQGESLPAQINITDIQDIGANNMLSPWDPYTNWTPVTREQMEDWMLRVGLVEESLYRNISSSRANTADYNKRKARLHGWFMTPTEYTEQFADGARIPRINNSAMYEGTRVQPARKEYRRVREGNVSAYMHKTIQRALKKLNNEIGRVRNEEIYLFTMYGRPSSMGDSSESLGLVTMTNFFPNTYRLERLLSPPSMLFGSHTADPNPNPNPTSPTYNPQSPNYSPTSPNPPTVNPDSLIAIANPLDLDPADPAAAFDALESEPPP